MTPPDGNTTYPARDAEAPHPLIEHAECDHPRWCAVTGRPVPGFGPDGPLVDVSGDRTLGETLLVDAEYVAVVRRSLQLHLSLPDLTRVQRDDLYHCVGQLEHAYADLVRLGHVYGRQP